MSVMRNIKNKAAIVGIGLISFSRDSVQIRIEGESKVTIANKTSENTYSFPGQETTYTFSQNGFISESTPPKSCTYKYTYSFK